MSASTVRRVTIRDVAEAARVSRQTVSRAMNDMPGINAGTKERVLQAARDLGYHPSRFGRGLVLGDHHTIGLVIDNLLNPYYPELSSAVVTRAAERGWTVVLLDCSGVDQGTLLAQMAGQVDVLIGYLHLDHADLDAVAPGVPMVRIDPVDPRRSASSVQFDLHRGMAEVVDHLVQRGVRRPVMLDSSLPGELTSRAREFVKQMAKAGVESPVVHAGDQLSDGIRATNEIIIGMPRTDAIMCFNDITAFGALKALRQQHRQVPGAVRVVGVDGLAAGTYVTPQLTSLALDMGRVAAVAVDVALGLLDGSVEPGSPSARRKVRPKLIIRESS